MENELKELVFDDLQELKFEDESKQIEEQNLIGSTFNVPGAAIRSALQGKGYTEGALRPSSVRKFQDIAIEKAQFTTNPVINFALGMPASTVGMAADILTSPIDVATAGATSLKPVQALGTSLAGTKVGKAIGGAITSKITPMKWVKDAFSGIRKAKAAGETSKEAILSKSAEQIGMVRSEGSRLKGVVSTLSRKQKEAVSSEIDGLSKALESAEKKYSGKIADVAFTKSSEVRKELPSLFKRKSEEYGVGLQKVLNENPVVATKAEVIPLIEESLMNHGILTLDDAGKIKISRTGATRAESEILKEYMRLKDYNVADTARINIGELLQSQSIIKPKYGKAWSPSEHLQSEVAEGISSLVAQKSPAVAEYRKAYAPFLEWKKAAIKEFQPFSGKFSNKKGTQVLSKYADISKRLSQDEIRLMSELEKQTGKDFTSQLKSLRGLGKDIKERKENIKITAGIKGKEVDDAVIAKKSAIDNLIASRIESIKNREYIDINSINDETRDIIDGLKRRRLIIGGIAAATAGSAFLKYIKNRLTYGLFGITVE